MYLDNLVQLFTSSAIIVLHVAKSHLFLIWLLYYNTISQGQYLANIPVDTFRAANSAGEARDKNSEGGPMMKLIIIKI